MPYGEIASILAEQQGVERMSAQAVGSAVGYNPILIIIPCHILLNTNMENFAQRRNYERRYATV